MMYNIYSFDVAMTKRLYAYLIICDIVYVTTEDIHQSSKAEMTWDVPPSQ